MPGGWGGGGRGGGYVGAKNHNLIFFSRHDFFVNLTIISERNFWKKYWGGLGGGSIYRQKFKIKKILQNMTFIANYMIPSLINFWKKNFSQKFFKVLEEGGTYIQITKIKKMFQNMIFFATYTIISQRNFWKKDFGQKFF